MYPVVSNTRLVAYSTVHISHHVVVDFCVTFGITEIVPLAKYGVVTGAAFCLDVVRFI